MNFIADLALQVLLDELVRPPNPITDYLTQHSGITPAMMEGVTTTLANVQVPLVDNLADLYTTVCMSRYMS